ncbi:MAG TPA: DUF268 domain-containing protein, partial [Thermoanaerobaculia bacterium]|nr:DUF268 domain-containing protein [Thermoanaerobaculia bacterium]
LRMPRFMSEWMRFRSAGGNAAAVDLYPCLFDRTATTDVDAHYFYQAIWATKRIVDSGAKSHVDVGSHTFFVGTLTAFTDVTFVDIRPIALPVERLSMKQGTIVELPFESGSLASLSSLHVIEHIGLGRYGDPIDPRGAERAAAELQRVLRPGGRLYLTTPIGRRRVQFNSQRIFDPRDIVALFGACRLAEFSVIDTGGTFRENVPIDTNIDVRSGNDFGLGMFVFEKLA